MMTNYEIGHENEKDILQKWERKWKGEKSMQVKERKGKQKS